MSTVMSAAFRRAGVDPEEAAFNVAIARYQNNGGSMERALMLVRAAYEMLGEGHCSLANDGPVRDADAEHDHLPDRGQLTGAGNGQPVHASVRQQNGDGAGHETSVARDQPRLARTSPTNGDGTGYLSRASDGPTTSARLSPTQAGRVLRSVQLQREPSPTDIAAMIAARKRAADVILKIDGDDIMDFTIGRALTDARRKGKEHYVLSTLGGMYKELPHNRTFRDVATAEVVKNIVRQAEAYANAT